MSVLTLRPNANSSSAQTNSSYNQTDNYSYVDEETKNESDHLYAVTGSTDNTYYSKLDIYGFPNHTSESGTINKVTVKCYAKYTLEGTDTSSVYVNPAVKIGSTVYSGGNQTLTTSYALYSYDWTVNPATTAAWSWTEIDDLLAGDTLTSHYTSNKNQRLAFNCQLWVEVDYTEGGGKPHYYYLQQ
jgi:hypothetical protein